MDRLTEIFTNHRQLMAQFREVERQTTPLGDLSLPVNLQTYAGQARVREEIGRISEEVAEVIAADSTNVLEEVADVLSFLVELLITIGVEPETLYPHCGDLKHDALYCSFSDIDQLYRTLPWIVRDHWQQFVILLWDWAHELKAKPWKLKPKPTNEQGFRDFSKQVFRTFLMCCYLEQITDVDLFRAYTAKSIMNRQRIASSA